MQILNRLLAEFFDNTEARQQAAQMVGEVLLSDGEAAATQMAMKLSRGPLGKMGAAAGVLATSPVSVPAIAGRQASGQQSKFNLFDIENE